MKAAIGIVLILCGCVLGLYVGFWLMLVGGVVDVVAAIRADVLDCSELGWGIAKCMLAQFVGVAAMLLLAAPGAAMLKDE